MTLVENELKNAYIGEYVEKTYTIAKGGTIDIAKSGFKVKQIKTSFTSSASATNQYMSASINLGDDSGNYSMGIPYTYLSKNVSDNNKLLNLFCKYNGNQTNEYTSPALTPVNGPFALEFTTTTDSVKCICNNNSILDQSATTKWKQTAEYLFSLSKLNVQYYLGGSSSYYTGSNEVTVTVIYEKI